MINELLMLRTAGDNSQSVNVVDAHISKVGCVEYSFVFIVLLLSTY